MGMKDIEMQATQPFISFACVVFLSASVFYSPFKGPVLIFEKGNDIPSKI